MPMTHRQWLAWQEWLDLDMLVPRRGDLYVAQASAAVGRVLSKHPRQIKLEHAAGEVNAYVETAKKLRQQSTPAARAAQIAASKSQAIAAVGGKVERRTVARADAFGPV